MRSCLWRFGRLGQGLQWSLLLAVLIFLLFALPSFIKEPSTRPSRTPAPENSALDTQRQPTAPAGADSRTDASKAPRRERGRVASTAQTALPKRQEKEKTVAGTPKGPDSGTEAPSLKSRVTKTTRGSGGQTRKVTATRTALAQGKAVTTAKTPIPDRQGTLLPTTGAVLTTRQRGVTTAAVPPTKKKAQVTPPATLLQSGTTRTTQRQRLKASNFKAEPRWDFEEKYSMEKGGLQTTCTDSVKVKASKSPWLRNLFLPNLTLFLDSSHFNQSEWERLEHFAPPFGFMELKHSLVQKVVTRFPPVGQQQLLLAGLPPGSSGCVTCAVVGNGGILNNSRVGQEIDSHDYVFRLSGAVIKGYEQDVGTRTSFYGFTAFSVTQSLLILGNRGFRNVPLGKDIRYLHFLEGTRDYEWLEALLLNQTVRSKNLFGFRHRPQEVFREDLQLDRYLLLHPDFLRYMKNRFLRSKTLDTVHWRIYRPTTGALLLLTALHLCDQVSAYGFITKGHERFSDHYYDKSWKKLIFYINHDFKLEREVWKRLHDEGIIRLYQRPETAKAKN
ncbi:PREDICTED: alpha-N-acetylgalactosaminide alpha-2,6-sialyltransferase 1 isoform X2 [Propithecus coquereli]|uniref:alpha-N-acetylgalactosaminide alpha-2,6-sialyltransferase 1 isoform X2 n=1 Tax=Propithecus coquereli TaxID=379532 RepID=UPI00063FA3EE|nr:PREDICTED: alpha-N-acetylgalactosaminide alpha-2,6-sialyltransferase 1 isoform X2 [Propithecus coquereli]